MSNNRSFDTATPAAEYVIAAPARLPAALIYANEAELYTVLSADQVTPIAFSRARLFRKPQYGVFAEIRTSRRAGDYVLFSICRALSNGSYDMSDKVYETSCYEDLQDIWGIFVNG